MKLIKFALSMAGVLAAVVVVYLSSFSPIAKLSLFVVLFGSMLYLAVRHRPTIKGGDLVHPRDGSDNDF
jgi:hypothetical protein